MRKALSDYCSILFTLYLPYISETGSRPRFALLTLVIATSSSLQVALRFNSNHLTRVISKHTLELKGLSLEIMSSVLVFNFNSIPISLQSDACFLMT